MLVDCSVLLSASQPIWSLPPEGVAAALQSTLQGLSHPEAQRRLQRFGANRLPSLRRRPLWLRFTDQLLHFMALLLWVAGAMAFAAHMPQLGWAIWAVVLVNGLFSFVQEYQAERTLAALKRSLPHAVRLWRDGELTTLAAADLVPGDRILLEEGGQVPADARLIRSVELYLDLSVLTGESLPVARHGEPIASLEIGDDQPKASSIPMRERANLVLAGTTVASGHGEAMVYATGGETEFGHVAHLTAATERGASTLEMQVGQIVRTITAIAVLMGLLTFGLSLLFVGVGPLESLIFAVGIIVANVPEGLLPTVTLALALSVQRMARQNALVRRLSAVETLGSVSVICSDKTGTLTCNRMAVEATWLPDPGDDHQGTLLQGACLCSNAHMERSPGPVRAIGDPTETALLLAAVAHQLSPERLQKESPRLRELPFDSHRRRMSVVVRQGDGLVLFTKGAPVEVLAHCTAELSNAGPVALKPSRRQRAVAANDDFSSRGYRVLAVAMRHGGEELLTTPNDGLETNLVLVGLLALYDPPRPEVPEAIRQCHQAGIKVTMVTG
ncbi:MAG: cation-transporting P-type ATPase, partial [Cyanobium sp. LacPavin_0920_WC12_MAG_62_9]|nr:cation-transporting P-type ATPase [Cyanobium sp. LacPavin_0920_WC12_MAG_62_9]